MSGRPASNAQALVDELRRSSLSELSSAARDVDAQTLEHYLERLAPDVVVHASGPFQGQDYRVATACVASGVHYMNFADGREFVAGIGASKLAARDAKVAVISGASSVPALPSAAADHLAQDFVELHGIDLRWPRSRSSAS